MPELVLDTCCLINLFATGEFAGILATAGSAFHVSRAVLAETLYIREPDREGEVRRRRIVVEPQMRSGLLRLCELRPGEETELYVRLAADLADGEAMSIAIAKCRGMAVATDDRKARRIARELAVSLRSTAELIKTWAEVGHVSENAVRAAVRNVQELARFVPADDMPCAGWWQTLAASAESD